MKTMLKKISHALYQWPEGGNHPISPKLSDQNLMAEYLKDIGTNGSRESLEKLAALAQKNTLDDHTEPGLVLLKDTSTDLQKKLEGGHPASLHKEWNL
jgi:hypothetical protein